MKIGLSRFTLHLLTLHLVPEQNKQSVFQRMRAEREKRINEARGGADRFLKAYAQCRKAKDVTSARLYLEAIEEILPKLKTVVVDPGGKNDIQEFTFVPGGPWRISDVSCTQRIKTPIPYGTDAVPLESAR